MPETTPDAAVSQAADAAPRRGFHPDRVVPRPQPAPKAAAASEPGLLKKARSIATKKSRSIDADAARRQKKMTLLVGVLSVVFIVVILISFGGGIGQSSAAPAVKDEVPAAAPVSRFDPDAWVFPEPLPAQMRNPLVIPKPQTLPEDPLAIAQSTHLAVRGIVHSDAKPSAIVGDQVATEGQTLYGVTIVKITRETVEFERDGNRWTQRVE